MLTIVQAGYGPSRALVVAYFIGNKEALLKSLPRSACVIVDLDGKGGRFARPVGAGGVDTIAKVVEFAHRALGSFEVDTTILVGWSIGAQAVREQLRAGARIEVAIALDGTSGNVPPTAVQLAPWKAASEAARRGEMLCVVTATQLTYTRTLPPAKRFESTVYVATELWKRERPLSPAELLVPGDYQDGSFRVEVHASGPVDDEAHRREQNVHLPAIIGRVVMPWLEGRAPVTQPTGAAPVPLRTAKVLQTRLNEHGASPPLDVDGDIGPLTRGATKAFQRRHGLPVTGAADEATWAALEEPTEPSVARGAHLLSQADLDTAIARLRAEVGVHETPGAGTTPRVVEYGKGAERRGKLLDLGNTDEPAWCCVVQGYVEKGLDGAIIHRWAVSEAWADAVANKTARLRTYRGRRGDLAVFARAGQDPRNGGKGHLTRAIEDVDDRGDYPAIGGNEGGPAHHGGEVLLSTRNVDDETLVGWIVRS